MKSSTVVCLVALLGADSCMAQAPEAERRQMEVEKPAPEAERRQMETEKRRAEALQQAEEARRRAENAQPRLQHPIWRYGEPDVRQKYR